MLKNATTTAKPASEQADRQTEDIRSALEHALRGQQGDVSPAELIGLAYDDLPSGAPLDNVLPIAREIAAGWVSR